MSNFAKNLFATFAGITRTQAAEMLLNDFVSHYSGHMIDGLIEQVAEKLPVREVHICYYCSENGCLYAPGDPECVCCQGEHHA